MPTSGNRNAQGLQHHTNHKLCHNLYPYLYLYYYIIHYLHYLYNYSPSSSRSFGRLLSASPTTWNWKQNNFKISDPTERSATLWFNGNVMAKARWKGIAYLTFNTSSSSLDSIMDIITWDIDNVTCTSKYDFIRVYTNQRRWLSGVFQGTKRHSISQLQTQKLHGLNGKNFAVRSGLQVHMYVEKLRSVAFSCTFFKTLVHWLVLVSQLFLCSISRKIQVFQGPRRKFPAVFQEIMSEAVQTLPLLPFIINVFNMYLWKDFIERFQNEFYKASLRSA